jgi:hypothetical protein
MIGRGAMEPEGLESTVDFQVQYELEEIDYSDSAFDGSMRAFYIKPR